MIYKQAISVVLFGVFACCVYGQGSSAYDSKWQTKAIFGVNIPITKLYQGTEVDYLLGYDDNSYYWQILSVSYFFHKHWGLEFNFQTSISNRIRHRADYFNANMESEYIDKYYIRSGSGTSNSEFSIMGGDMLRGYIGAIYRFETDKLYIYPKFSIGVTSLYTDWGRVDLKEKNSNNEFKVSYSNGKGVNDYFTLASSASFGYKIMKRFYFNADIMFSYFRTNITYKKDFTNLYTNEHIVEHFDYKKNIFTLSLGVGLIFIIK